MSQDEPNQQIPQRGSTKDLSTLGYRKNLFILPFDHLSSFEAGLLGIRGRQADPQEVEQLAGYKRIIYEGFLEAIENSVPLEHYCRTGLATMSYRQEALHVLQALNLEQTLDVVLTREDVERPKPDPEIYRMAAEKLEVPPQECLVLEDSPNGVRAGVAAGMNVVAVATPFTVAGLHSSQVLEHAWVVHDPEKLLEVVKERIAEHNRTEHPN